VREKMKRLNSLLDDFTTLFLGFYISLFLYSEIGREEGKKMRSELALADDTPYTYIHLQMKSSWLSYSSSLDNTGAWQQGSW
jgi:hypothetical protein